MPSLLLSFVMLVCGARSLRQVGNAVHAEHHLQRHSHVNRIDLTARRGVELFLDMLPRRFFPVIFRQMLH
jgi:hypothetical protein